MTTVDQIERDLTTWFGETPVGAEPDLLEDILIETRGLGQRPRWMFLPPLPRPMDRPLVPGGLRTAPQRPLVILVMMAGLLALMAGTAFVASRPNLPAPFGPAANGLVAYAKGGDIFLVDPETGGRTSLVAGPEVDDHPRWSLDGTRLAFVREISPAASRLVIVDAAGNVLAESGGDPLLDVDPDGVRWAPDGLKVAVRASYLGRDALYLIDATTGRPTLLPITPWGLEAYWRPPDGRELLFIDGPELRPALYRYSLTDGAITAVPGAVLVPSEAGSLMRPVGWTADGSRFAYHRSAPTPTGFVTAVVNVETGEEVILDLAYGRISNDGTRIVGLAADGSAEWICVAPVGGGPCEPIEGDVALFDPTGWASFQWAPDDSTIMSRPNGGAAVLLKPNGGEPEWPSWAQEGADSWQRRAP